MGLWNNDDELRDSDGHLPNTMGRNIAAVFAALLLLSAFVLVVWIIGFV